jgi:hypothetical protein
VWHPTGIAIVEFWHDLAFKRRLKSLGIPFILLGFVATMVVAMVQPISVPYASSHHPSGSAAVAVTLKDTGTLPHEPLIMNQGYMRAKAGARVTKAICPQIWFLPRVTVVVAREPNGLRARYKDRGGRTMANSGNHVCACPHKVGCNPRLVKPDQEAPMHSLLATLDLNQ